MFALYYVVVLFMSMLIVMKKFHPFELVSNAYHGIHAIWFVNCVVRKIMWLTVTGMAMVM